MKTSNEEERLAESALRRRFAGGRSRLARVLDYVLLRILLLAGAYLYFAETVKQPLPALLLGVIFLALCMVVLRIVREVRFARFLRREMERLRGLLLLDRLLLMAPRQMRELCLPLCDRGDAPLLLPCAGPAGQDAILSALHAHRGKGRLALFAMGGYTKEAKALLLRLEDRVRVMDPAQLRKAAGDAGMLPGVADVRRYLAALFRQEQADRISRRTLHLGGEYGKKYVATGMLLLGLSFLTRYALYYRLLAGLSMTIGTLILYRQRRDDAPS